MEILEEKECLDRLQYVESSDSMYRVYWGDSSEIQQSRIDEFDELSFKIYMQSGYIDLNMDIEQLHREWKKKNPNTKITYLFLTNKDNTIVGGTRIISTKNQDIPLKERPDVFPTHFFLTGINYPPEIEDTSSLNIIEISRLVMERDLDKAMDRSKLIIKALSTYAQSQNLDPTKNKITKVIGFIKRSALLTVRLSEGKDSEEDSAITVIKGSQLTREGQQSYLSPYFEDKSKEKVSWNTFCIDVESYVNRCLKANNNI